MSKDKIKRPVAVHNLELFKMLVGRSSVEWVVVHTNPKCERRAHDGLMAKGILAYLPIECIERTFGANTKTKKAGTYLSKRPMFQRYLFAGIDVSAGQSVDDVRACDGVKGLVCIGENGAPTRVGKSELCDVIDVSHGTFEGGAVPDGFMAVIARLPEGSALSLVKGCWTGIDYVYTGYDEAKERLHGYVNGQNGQIPMSVPVDAVKIPDVVLDQDDSSDPSGTGESIHHKNGATEAADPAN